MMTKEVRCPQCGSKKLYKDGLRYLKDGDTVQRWLCKSCGYRFSDPDSKEDCTCSSVRNIQKIPTSSLKTPDSLPYGCQVGVARARGAKNLVKVTSRQEKAMREGTTRAADIKGKLVEFAWTLKKEGYREGTIRSYIVQLESLVRRGANLFDPEYVKGTIAKQNVTEKTKLNYANSYDAFAKTVGIHWQKPRYKPGGRLPHIPLERDIDTVINGAGKNLGVALLIAKGTALRIGEIIRLQWTDIDPEKNLIVMNSPEKRSNPGAYKVSHELISRTLSLPKKHNRLFPTTVNSITARLRNTRKRLAKKLENPRLHKITFHTLRHWKATMLYHKTRDIFYVKDFLRHRDIRNTMIYINVERLLFQNSNNDEFHAKVATTLNEACDLIKVGFEFVTDMDGVKLFRKRK